MLRENDEEAYEEVVTVSKVSSKVKLETAFAHTTKEATVTPKFLTKEEQGIATLLNIQVGKIPKSLLQLERKGGHDDRLLIFLLTKDSGHQTLGGIAKDTPTTNLKIRYSVKNMYVYRNFAATSHKEWK